MLTCENKFWLERFAELFCELDPIPLTSMSLERQLNALTRLVVLITILLIPCCGIKSLIFFGVGIVFIIILFYSLRNMNCKEHFQICTNKQNSVKSENLYNPTVEFYRPHCGQREKKCSKNIDNPGRFPPPKVQNFGPSFYSANQALVGKPAERTMIPPIMVDPPLAESWKENGLVVRPGINSATNQDLSRSGYLVSGEAFTCTDSIGQESCCETFDSNGKDVNTSLVESTYPPARDIVENYEELSKPEKHGEVKEKKAGYFQQSYDYPYKAYGKCGEKQTPIEKIEISPYEFSGDVLRSDGYFPKQIMDDNLPSNVAFGECAKDNVFKEYNKQTYTSTLQPGVYTRNQIVEPISSNIGISFTQQFEPVTCEKDCNGVTFIGHDPNVMEIPHEKAEQLQPYDKQTHISDIYDPRFTGYGTSYRSYVEPVTGQVRFYYDDVDAYKRPSYLSRSKVDFIPSSVGIQPMPNTEYFAKQNKFARSIANDAFMDDTISFRTDMQERLMRKANANLEQKRRFPSHTQSFTRGGMSNPRG